MEKLKAFKELLIINYKILNLLNKERLERKKRQKQHCKKIQDMCALAKRKGKEVHYSIEKDQYYIN